MLDEYSPIVTPHMNFDSLLIPKDHVSRGVNDTYYVNKSHLLRTHTSAHQAQTMSSGMENFLVCGDVYRRDEIDARYILVCVSALHFDHVYSWATLCGALFPNS